MIYTINPHTGRKINIYTKKFRELLNHFTYDHAGNILIPKDDRYYSFYEPLNAWLHDDITFKLRNKDDEKSAKAERKVERKRKAYTRAAKRKSEKNKD